MSIVSACPRQIEVHICVGRHGNFGFVGCRSNRCMGLSTCAGDVGRPRLLRESVGRPRIPSRGPRREGKPCPDLPVTDEPHLTAKNSTAAGRKDAHRCKSFLTLPRVLSVLAAECRIFKLSGKMHFCCRSNARYHPRPKAVGCMPMLDPGLQTQANPLENPHHHWVVVQAHPGNDERQHQPHPMPDRADNCNEHEGTGQKPPASDRQSGPSATNRSESSPGHCREEQGKGEHDAERKEVPAAVWQLANDGQ